MQKTFSASIAGGKIDTRNGKHIAAWIKARRDGPIALTIATGADVDKRLRSDPQNRYYWGVIVKGYLGAMIEAGDTTVEEARAGLRLDTLIDTMHELLKYEFAGCEVIDYNTGEIRKLPISSSKMTTVEMGVYWDKIRAACLERYGAEILPPPDDLFATEQPQKPTTR